MYMAPGDDRGQKVYLLTSPQYASVPDPRQNVENNEGRKPLLYWCSILHDENKQQIKILKN